MSLYVLDCRVFFTDEGNAQNAFNHIKALAEHSAAHDVQVGKETEGSWARLHECKVDENDGDTSECADLVVFDLTPEEPEEPGGEVTEWAPGLALAVDDLVSYEGVTYRVVQAHTTQAGWTPPAVPALFEAI